MQTGAHRLEQMLFPNSPLGLVLPPESVRRGFVATSAKIVTSKRELKIKNRIVTDLNDPQPFSFRLLPSDTKPLEPRRDPFSSLISNDLLDIGAVVWIAMFRCRFCESLES